MLDWDRLCEIEDIIRTIESHCVTDCKGCIGKEECILSHSDITAEELEEHYNIESIEMKLRDASKNLDDYNAGLYNGMTYVYNTLIHENYNECVKVDGKWGIKK